MPSVELRQYLRNRGGRNGGHNEAFESFLKDALLLFDLRVSAEEYWEGTPPGVRPRIEPHRYTAARKNNALPLEWDSVDQILCSSEDHPPETLISYIARHHALIVQHIAEHMRHILTREREKTPLARVQMMDAHCMRWLLRQPGRTTIEKAGTEQRILSVVRREQFNTLENRVLKDYILRCIPLVQAYLNEYKVLFPTDPDVRSVLYFGHLCQSISEMEVFSQIADLTSFPYPNYVLLQDRFYSQVWNGYKRVIQFARVAEALWDNRVGLSFCLASIREESMWQKENSAHHHTQLWVNPLDGYQKKYIEGPECDTPVHSTADDTLLRSRKHMSHFPVLTENGIAIIDLHDDRITANALVISDLCHPNARPSISKTLYPMPAEGNQLVRLSEILKNLFPRRMDETANSAIDRHQKYQKYAQDFFISLFGELRAEQNDRRIEKVILLVPDDWPPSVQERLIQACSVLGRNRITLLWRSVATVLGATEIIEPICRERRWNPTSVSVVDFRSDQTVLRTTLSFIWSDQEHRYIPQRKSYLSESHNPQVYFCCRTTKFSTRTLQDFAEERRATPILLTGNVPSEYRRMPQPNIWVEPETTWWQHAGAIRFAEKKLDEILFYDALEPMWIVGIDNEHPGQIVSKSMVKGDAEFPGGQVLEDELPQGLLSIPEGQTSVAFYLHVGSSLTDDTRLHEYLQKNPHAQVSHNPIPLAGTIRVTPGQGIAVVTIAKNEVFEKDIVLDYVNNMHLGESTIRTLQDKLNIQNFPPSSAIVEAYPRNSDHWKRAFHAITECLNRNSVLGFDKNKNIFSHAIRKTTLQANESELHKLDRLNVFGNTPKKNRPQDITEQDVHKFIKLLCEGLNEDDAIRHIAWTYRGNHPSIREIVENVLEEYSTKKNTIHTISTEKISLLSNCLPDKQNDTKNFLKKCATILQHRLKNKVVNNYDFRLFYNLLQFTPDYFDRVSYEAKHARCVMENIIWYLSQNEESETRQRDCLRAFIYFLRIRKKHWSFLRQEETDEWSMSDLYSELYELIPYYENPGGVYEKTCTFAFEFLIGEGSLEGLLAID